MEKNFFALDGKKIIITGSASGIGRQCAIECSRLGAKIMMLDINAEGLEETITLLQGTGHIAKAMDLTRFEEIGDTLNELLSGFGQIDGMIHCTGIQQTLAFGQMKTPRFNHLFDVNVFSGLEIARVITNRKWLSENGASIVFIASTMGVVGRTGLSGYSATKGALISVARSMAAELSRKKVRVNCISPGFIRTKMMQDFLAMKPETSTSDSSQRYLLGYGEPEDIANACIFLLSDASRWITGVNLPVDGGYLAN